jgi:drug/metabolite transporter (DMT)-like permease
LTINLPLQKWLYLFAIAIIWGSSYILIKKGLEGFGFMQAATIRLMAAGLVFLPFGIYHFRKIPFRKFPVIVVSGLLAMFIPSYLFSIAQQHVQSSLAGILVAMTPSFTFLFSIIFFKKTYSKIQVVGLLLGLICSIVLSIMSSGGSELSINIYVWLIIIATLGYGININIVKYFLSDVPSQYMSTVSVSLNGLFAFLVFIPNRNEFLFVHDNVGPLIALLTLGIFGTALAQLLHNRLIFISTPLFASSITYLIPVIAIAWGLVDQEPITLVHFISCIGILISVYMIRKEKTLSINNRPPFSSPTVSDSL